MSVTKTLKLTMTKEQWNAINQALNDRRLDAFALTALLKEAGAGPELINPPPPELPDLAPLSSHRAAPSMDETASGRSIEPRPATPPREPRPRQQPPNSQGGRKDVKPAPKDRRPARVQSGRRGSGR
jgi:hypothetical protein